MARTDGVTFAQYKGTYVQPDANLPMVDRDKVARVTDAIALLTELGYYASGINISAINRTRAFLAFELSAYLQTGETTIK